MRFRHSIHNQVLQILQALDPEFLTSCQVLFGGGTMLALAYGEYRLSRDLDFLGQIILADSVQPDWSPIACLSVVDQVTQKLLENGDRWADASIDSRDLIDLAILK